MISKRLRTGCCGIRVRARACSHRTTVYAQSAEAALVGAGNILGHAIEPAAVEVAVAHHKRAAIDDHRAEQCQPLQDDLWGARLSAEERRA